MRVKVDRFVLAIFAVVLLAYVFPEPGRNDSDVPLDRIASAGVSLIFFFYGLKLNKNKIASGLRNWRLHVLVQVSTFIVFPLVIIAVLPLIHHEHAHAIWLAFLFLAALPSAVSSSVVMVSVARGNVPAAIFNASISGLIGIAVTPLWMGLFIHQHTAGFNLTDIYLKLIAEILVPLSIGLILQRFLGVYAQRYGKQLTTFDKSIILLIVYRSFAESFASHVFDDIGVRDLMVMTFATLALFFLIYFLIGWVSVKVGFSREDRITAQFCGTKKSLVHGTVFSKILFQHLPSIGIMLLPLMLFHALQLFIISVVASRLESEQAE